MSDQNIANAMRRVESILRRRPAVGLHDDAPATARWESGTRVVSSHSSGARITTDIATELGGSGDQVTPGWLFRAGLAACAATRIAMSAAADGIELTVLEVVASSRSDVRGMLGMTDPEGRRVPAGSRDVQIRVRIGGSGVNADRLRVLVEDGLQCSPVYASLLHSVPMNLHIEFIAG